MEASEPVKRRMMLRLAMPLLATVMVTSCTQQISGHSARVPVAQPWTGVMAEVSVVWSADPGTDLLTGPAVVLRAYVESYLLVMAMGTTEVVYPGFTRAVDAAPGTGDVLSDPWPDVTSPLPHPLVGTDRLHLLRLGSDELGVESIVCYYSPYTMAFDLGDGNYGYDPGSLDDGVDVMQVTMTETGPTAMRLPPQQGPAASPIMDVFGNWRIDSLRETQVAAIPEWPTAVEDLQACRDRAPDPPERRKFLRQGKHSRSDYPTLPAYPGWPAAPPS